MTTRGDTRPREPHGCLLSLGAVTGKVDADGPEVKVGLFLVVRFEGGVPVRVEEYLDADRAPAAAGLA